MIAHILVDPTSTSGMPAPYWFVEFFKVLGFTLHLVPMNLWYAGLLVALVIGATGCEHCRRMRARLARQLPLLLALGINFGIVPLLFTQVAYNKAFYPATILMAWFWMAIVVLLIPAYYGVYLYAHGLKGSGVFNRDEDITNGSGQSKTPDPFTGSGLAPWRRAAGWLAALFFIAIAFLFANGWSLMTRADRWLVLWEGHNVAGAATGAGLNWTDPTLWPRWLMLFGLALGTTAIWAIVDVAWLGRRESAEYQAWVPRLAKSLYTLSLAWFAVAGAWYAFFTWLPEVRGVMFGFPGILLTALTAAAPAGLLVWLYRRRLGAFTRTEASLLAAGQLGVLAVNAISRQIVQNVELKGALDVGAQETAVQWSPMLVFLLLFVAGMAVVAWMVAQVVKVETAAEVGDKATG